MRVDYTNMFRGKCSHYMSDTSCGDCINESRCYPNGKDTTDTTKSFNYDGTDYGQYCMDESTHG